MGRSQDAAGVLRRAPAGGHQNQGERWEGKAASPRQKAPLPNCSTARVHGRRRGRHRGGETRVLLTPAGPDARFAEVTSRPPLRTCASPLRSVPRSKIITAASPHPTTCCLLPSVTVRCPSRMFLPLSDSPRQPLVLLHHPSPYKYRPFPSRLSPHPTRCPAPSPSLIEPSWFLASMGFSGASLAVLLISLLAASDLLLAVDGFGVEQAGPGRSLLTTIDCRAKCAERCRLSRRHNLCHRACGTCCRRCNCVPPGTYGNREVCSCYASMTTHGGRLKCP